MGLRMEFIVIDSTEPMLWIAIAIADLAALLLGTRWAEDLAAWEEGARSVMQPSISSSCCLLLALEVVLLSVGFAVRTGGADFLPLVRQLLLIPVAVGVVTAIVAWHGLGVQPMREGAARQTLEADGRLRMRALATAAGAQRLESPPAPKRAARLTRGKRWRRPSKSRHWSTHRSARSRTASSPTGSGSSSLPRTWSCGGGTTAPRRSRIHAGPSLTHSLQHRHCLLFPRVRSNVPFGAGLSVGERHQHRHGLWLVRDSGVRCARAWLGMATTPTATRSNDAR